MHLFLNKFQNLIQFFPNYLNFSNYLILKIKNKINIYWGLILIEFSCNYF